MQNEMSKRLDDLEETLIDEVQEDSRLSSGTPENAADGDLDFITMTGLTTPSSMESVADVSPVEPVEDMNPDAPVTFYEKGVEDVDSTMVPDDTAESLGDEEELVSSTAAASGNESSIEGLKGIIADLAGEADSSDVSDDVPDTPIFLDPENAEESNEPDVSEETLAELNLEATQSALENFDVADPVVDETTDSADDRGLQVLPSLDDEFDDVEAEALEEDESERDSAIYNRPLRGKKNQSRHRRRRTPMGYFIRSCFVILLIVIILGGAYYSLELYADRALTSHEMMAKAQRAMNDDKYAEAGRLFDELVVRYPDDPLVGEAQFMTAYALQLIPDTNSNAEDFYQNSIGRFERFLVDQPRHEKTNRAETLLGMLYYRMEDYPRAITLLSNSNRRIKDPGAYLSTLRMLARSYAATSQIAESHTAFLRAATLDSNMTPEEDYLELASLYVELAGRSASSVMQERYQTLAIEQWDHAIDVPGILSYLKNDIQLAREAMIEQMAQNKGIAPKGKYEKLTEEVLEDLKSQN
jgi:tetratricopeptide (TPR) repeat protein